MQLKWKDLFEDEPFFVYMSIFWAEMIVWRLRRAEAAALEAPCSHDGERKDHSADSTMTGLRTATGVPKNPLMVVVEALTPSRRILAPLVFASCLWIGFAFVCMAPLLVSTRNRFLGEPIDKVTDLLLFCIAVPLFLWRVASAAKYNVATRLDTRIYSWRMAWPVHWALCLLLNSAIIDVDLTTIEPFITQKQCHVVPGMCRVHEQYHRSLTAKVSYWSLVIVLGSGGVFFNMTIRFMKLFTALGCFNYLYWTVFRPLFLRFALEPTAKYIVQPLFMRGIRPAYRHVAFPIWKTIREITSSPIQNYALEPLAKQFPGPQTKKDHLFGEPDTTLLVYGTLAATIYIATTSAAIFTMTAEDTLFIGQKKSMHFEAHLVSFFSLAIWLLWRFLSELNFAPAVRLEEKLYSSRLGWLLQFLIGFPWLCTIFRFFYFLLAICYWREGVLGRAIHRLSTLASFSFWGTKINILGFFFALLITSVLFLGCLYSVGLVVAAQITCLKRVSGHRMQEDRVPSSAQSVSDSRLSKDVGLNPF